MISAHKVMNKENKFLQWCYHTVLVKAMNTCSGGNAEICSNTFDGPRDIMATN